MKITASIISSKRLGDSDIEKMFLLHEQSFMNVDESIFKKNVSEKDWVIWLADERENLVGFSTQQLIHLDINGAPFHFLFSGDTVVDQANRNTPLLAGSFGHIMLRLMELHGQTRLYWFLISKGFRTYRFLPVFFNQYWPAPGTHTPEDIKELLAAIAKHKFGSAFNAATGIIKPSNGDYLKPKLATIPEQRLQDPHTAFFLERNPNYSRGEELACLTAISRENLNSRAWRAIKHTEISWHE